MVEEGVPVVAVGTTGVVAPDSAITTIRAMPESDLPGGGGLTFRCDGSALEGRPAVCTDAGLTTTLDAEGFPTTFAVTSGGG
ncbi:MAG TPA: hypothetical protein VFM27_08370 [Acidimicrobiales bacterium]|nr:hypothetical protein [Acidimicrobiales bacterium]